MANERILVVDDEKGVVHSCVRILQRQGFTVSGITESTVVPALLRQQTFDLLLTDIRMPKLDGLQLLQIAKTIDPHLTVVLITGYGTMEDAIKAIHFGAQGFLMKPFETEDLVATVQDSLTRRALLRDSLRLQTLLPLLEINQILQGSAGETSLARRVLEIAHRETGASRLAWLSRQKNSLTQIAVVPDIVETASQLPSNALNTVLAQARPVWLLADRTLIDRIDDQANIIGAILPMIIQGEVVGILTAETGEQGRPSPFDRISLDLLSVLAGQLAMILENIQLFEQTKTLHAFNEDLIQNMTNGLIAVDANGDITAFNPAAAAMLAQPAAQALNRPMTAALPAAAELTKILTQTLTTQRPLAHHEITIGQTPVSVNTAPLAGGAQGGAVAVLENLSERKALEAEHRRLDRLAALGEMSAVVAHEIRNPIASIAAGVEYLASKMAAGSSEASGAAMIQGEIQRVNRILEDILFVARPFQLNLSSENLADIIDSVIQCCQVQVKESQVAILTRHAANLPPLKLDRQRIEQVLTNLIINATQAMQNSGKPPTERQLVIQTDLAASLPEKVMITIADTGPGIPAEARPRIFEPFFTTKARGTGLGLAVARRIVEEHKGSIKSESAEGQGTRFIIALPISPASKGMLRENL